MHTLPACKAQRCNQGKTRCPVPDACRIPEMPDDELNPPVSRFLVACVLVTLAAICRPFF